MTPAYDKDAVTRVLGKISDFEDRVTRSDQLLLTSEERSSPHMVGHTEGGRTVRISLPRGTELSDGDVLTLDRDVAIIVTAALEDLFVVTPRDTLEWGIAGYQFGNLHKPVRFTSDVILTPADPIVADMLDRFKIPYERRMKQFVGRRCGSHIAHHDHDHS